MLQSVAPVQRERCSAFWRGDPATLSRWRHGFESRWGCQGDLPIRAGQVLFSGCRLVTFQYRPCPPFARCLMHG